MICWSKNIIQSLSFYILGHGICILDSYECPKSSLDIIIANNLLIIFGVGILATILLSRADKKRKSKVDFDNVLDN